MSLAVAGLSTHCSHQSLFTKALTVTESYEAVTICRIVALLQSNQVASLIKMSWIPQSLRTASLPDLQARLQFLLGKAAQTPGADPWKHWSGVNDKEYVSKNQKKKQQGAQEHCLLSLADLDFFFKSGKRAVERGQNYDNWLHGAGKKIFHSWSTRAASRGIDSDPIHQPVASVAQPGVPSTAHVGANFPNGVSLAESSMVGRQADHPACLAGGSQPQASGSGVPQRIQDMSLPDQLAHILSNVQLMECLGKYKASQ